MFSSVIGRTAPGKSHYISKFLSFSKLPQNAPTSNVHWRISFTNIPEIFSSLPPDMRNSFFKDECMYAQSATLPLAENLTVNKEFGSTSSATGNMIALPILNRHDPYKNLTINFLDTNGSVLDLIITPWIYAVAEKGLIARPEKESIKTDLYVAMHNPSLPDYEKPSRTYIFRNACPISRGSLEITNDKASFMRISTEWTFTHFELAP